MKNSKDIIVNPIIVKRAKFKHPDNVTYSWSVFGTDRPFRRAKPIFINRK